MTRKDRGNRKGRRGANYLNRHLKPHQPKDVVSFASELEESTLEQAQQLAKLPFIYPHVRRPHRVRVVGGNRVRHH